MYVCVYVSVCVKRESSREKDALFSRASEGKELHERVPVHKNRQSDCKYAKRVMEAAESSAMQGQTDGKGHSTMGN